MPTLSVNTAVASMPRSGIRAIMELAFARPGVINLCPGEPDFPTPAHVVEAADRAARAGATRYTPAAGIPELREAAAASINHRYRLGVGADNVIVTVGGVNALFLAMACLAPRHGRVLVPDPGWPNYHGHCALLGLEPIRYPLRVGDDYAPDPAVVARLAREHRASILITNSPSNPTGAVFEPGTVAGLVDVAARNGMYVIADEVYDQLTFDAAHSPAAAIDAERVVSVYSVSKTYAMTGWRIGYAVAAADLTRLMTKAAEAIVSCPTAPAQWAALAALTGPQDTVGVMRSAYRDRRDAAIPALRRERLFVAEPRGAFYTLADVSAATSDTLAFCRHLVTASGVACAPGETFGPGGAGLVRISLAAAPAAIMEGIRRVGDAVRAAPDSAAPAGAAAGRRDAAAG